MSELEIFVVIQFKTEEAAIRWFNNNGLPSESVQMWTARKGDVLE